MSGIRYIRPVDFGLTSPKLHCCDSCQPSREPSNVSFGQQVTVLVLSRAIVVVGYGCYKILLLSPKTGVL